MQDFTFEEPGHGGKTDVRMRAHIQADTWLQDIGPHLIQKNERPHHAPTRSGQGSANLEPIAEIAGAGNDQRFDSAH
jgi:hypothetical protein